MSQVAIAPRFRRKQRRPLQGNSASDRILRGPDCNRHSRVCADASVRLYRATPAVSSRRPSDAFSEAWRNLSVRCGPKTKNQTLGRNRLPPAGRPRTQIKERVGRTALFSSSAMSSGRLFLDRVGRHQSPSPLHRHGQHNLIAWPEGTNYHRTGNSVLTVCVSSGGRRK